MDVEDAYRDLAVAAVAAVCAVALTLVARYGLKRDVGLLPRVSPLFVYFLYIFSRRNDPGGLLGDARTWVALTVVVALAALGYALV